MIFLASKALGLTLNIILILVFGGFVAYNIYNLDIRIREKKTKAKKKKEDDLETHEKEI